MEKKFHDKIFRLIKDDITERKVDAIVNAANSYLRHGGGVAAAIVRKGGDIIQKESNNIDYVPVGSAVITSAGKLYCKSVIHAVGPQMREGDEDQKLKKTINSILEIATKSNFKSVSIPAISSGIFGFPKDRCANILVNESKNFIENKITSLETIEFCIYDDNTLEFFKKEFEFI